MPPPPSEDLGPPPTPPHLAITCGDPAGVGPEILHRLASQQPELFTQTTLLGPEAWLESFPPLPGLIKLPCGSTQATPGQPTADGSRIALQAMEIAAKGTKAGHWDAVVTGPVNKAALADIGYPFPGQTEFFAHHWHGEPTMAFAGGRLRVILATWHIPLAHVPSQFRHPEVLHRAVERAAKFAKAFGATRPRIGVCGLNPHAGEEGLLGSEEEELLNPQLESLRKPYPGLSPCLPADTLFHRALMGEFDVLIALYHDQGLTPLKTLEFDQAVNLTLGLPWLRTSPDHGTGYALAGKGQAKTTSFANAIRLARQLSTAFSPPHETDNDNSTTADKGS